MKNKTTINVKQMLRRNSLLAFATLLMSTFFFSCERMDELDIVKDVKEEQKARAFRAELHATNNSGVTGEAVIQYMKDGKFQVHVMARNLAPNMMHPQHIHGFGFEDEHPRKSVCPPMSAAGDDGLLTLEEAVPFIGPVLIPLDSEIVPLTEEEYSHANAQGQMNYLEFTKIQTLVTHIDEAHAGRQTLKNLALDRRVIEIHGAWVKDNRVVPAGTEGAEYNPTLPVACGEIKEVF